MNKIRATGGVIVEVKGSEDGTTQLLIQDRPSGVVARATLTRPQIEALVEVLLNQQGKEVEIEFPVEP